MDSAGNGSDSEPTSRRFRDNWFRDVPLRANSESSIKRTPVRFRVRVQTRALQSCLRESCRMEFQKWWQKPEGNNLSSGRDECKTILSRELNQARSQGAGAVPPRKIFAPLEIRSYHCFHVSLIYLAPPRKEFLPPGRYLTSFNTLAGYWRENNTLPFRRVCNNLSSPSSYMICHYFRIRKCRQKCCNNFPYFF